MCKSQNFQCVTVTESLGTIGRSDPPRLCKQKESSFEHGRVKEKACSLNVPLPAEGVSWV